jgi:ferrous iron transport protein A
METSTVPPPAGSSEALIPLTFLRTGQSGWVGDVVGSGGLVHRLREMGLRAGSRVQMLRSGSPCILNLDGQRLCIRSDEIAHVLVRV